VHHDPVLAEEEAAAAPGLPDLLEPTIPHVLRLENVDRLVLICALAKLLHQLLLDR
jgi:hypothetical protein